MQMETRCEFGGVRREAEARSVRMRAPLVTKEARRSAPRSRTETRWEPGDSHGSEQHDELGGMRRKWQELRKPGDKPNETKASICSAQALPGRRNTRVLRRYDMCGQQYLLHSGRRVELRKQGGVDWSVRMRKGRSKGME